MKVGVIGNSSSFISMADYVPQETTAIISGNTQVVESMALMYADANNISKLVIDFEHVDKTKKLFTICDIADYILVIWDGKSSEIEFAIKYARLLNKTVKVYRVT